MRIARAFTLTELVVVLAITTLLVGILLPTLGRVSAAGRSARCLSNLRQMAIAAQQYALDAEVYPAALRYEQRDGVHVTIAWDWAQETGGDLLGPGPLWAYTDDPGEVQQCPDYHGEAAFGADPYTGYNYNTTSIGAEATSLFSFGWDGLRGGARPAVCLRTSSCAMFGDGGRAGGTNKFMRAPGNREGFAAETILSGGQAYRHAGASNVAFVDGHVESRTAPHRGGHDETLVETVMGYPENGFLSEDDRAYSAR